MESSHGILLEMVSQSTSNDSAVTGDIAESWNGQREALRSCTNCLKVLSVPTPTGELRMSEHENLPPGESDASSYACWYDGRILPPAVGGRNFVMGEQLRLEGEL